MSKRRRQFQHYFLHSGTYVLGVVAVLLMLIHVALTVDKKSVPDSAGLHFRFSAPLCSKDTPAIVHVVPQTTEAVNVTLISLDPTVTSDRTHYLIDADMSLSVDLPCHDFQWGVYTSMGYELVSTAEVFVYINFLHDNLALLPTDVSGTEYVVTSRLTSMLNETFVVIHGDKTTVNVTLPGDCVSSTIEIDGQTIAGQSKLTVVLPDNGVLGILFNCDITGAHIKSDLPTQVFSGATNRASVSGGMIEQVPPLYTAGRRFLYSAHAWIRSNITVIITGAEMNAGITISTGDNTIRTNLSYPVKVSFDLELNGFMSVVSTASVLCAIVHELLDADSGRHPALIYLTPEALYHTRSNFNLQNEAATVSVNLILTQETFPLVTLNKTVSNPFDQLKISEQSSVPFHGSVYSRTNVSAYMYALSARVTRIYTACSPRPNGGNGDGLDNDCDNVIDEETLNHVDDDGDGRVDEDVRYSGLVVKGAVRETPWEYHVRNSEPEDTGFSTSVISIVISISVAITAVVCFIGGMLLAEKVRRSASSSRVTPIC
ncbi:hypothetical protein MAR_010574 [Mya arenaria]|uniref:IgGFc-binding protein N-terminal domain-containing protein n=1 Tax=Mya arenaria TaxID=6604 RepID=A0ABY7EA39_MYAAR|nr:hypothetical protein MAR_010574 [Mya arenaria]